MALNDALAHLERHKDDPDVGYITASDLVEAFTALYEDLDVQIKGIQADLDKIKKELF